MPISVELLEGEPILSYIIADPITVEEMRSAMNASVAMRDNTTVTIHILCDISSVTRVPINLMSMEKGSELRHPTMGYMAIVTQSRLIRMVTEILVKFTGFHRYSFFTNQEDALAYLHQRIKDETSS